MSLCDPFLDWMKFTLRASYTLDGSDGQTMHRAQWCQAGVYSYMTVYELKMFHLAFELIEFNSISVDKLKTLLDNSIREF